MDALPQNFNVVCHQLRSPDNLGAIARVMVNFGYARLILSDPATYAFKDAEKLGIRAKAVLDGLSVATDLKEALADCVFAVGTTSRTQLKRRAAIGPEQAAGRLATESLRGRVALVLGGEKRGLSDDELSLLDEVVVIPTHGAQPSMNVAQAAAVLLYLCARDDARAAAATRAPPEAAPRAVLDEIEARLRQALLAAEFLNPQAPDHVMRELARTLARARLSRREAELWLSAAGHLSRKLAP